MPDFERLTDSEMVTAFLAGDSDAFAGIYDRYADRIYSYCLTMLRNRDDAADAAHDTFVKAATRLQQLDDRDKLRPWLFAVARNEARLVGRRRARVTPEDNLSEVLADEPDLTIGVREAELRELVWAAADGLGERDRQLMAFHLTEGLEGPDLAEAMGVDTSHVHVMVSRMKDRVEKALGALLIARLGSEDCDQLSQVLGEWDGRFDIEVRSRVNRHVEKCDICTKRRSFLLAPANVLPGILVVPAPAALRDRVFDDVEEEAAVISEPAPQWTKLAVFAVVTLVLGLIGIAVSAQFEPLDIPSAAPEALGPPIAVASTTTTTMPFGSTSTTAPGVTESTLEQPPAAIAVSTTTIDFGPSRTSAEFALSNTGGQGDQWTVSSSSDSISVSLGSGELGPGETVTIQVGLDRGTIAEGEIAEVLAVAWSGGQADITVVGSSEANPVLHNPQATPAEVRVNGGTQCLQTQTTISVRVRDASPLASVVVRWSADGVTPQETPMSGIGNDMFEGVIGPFSVAQVAPIRIVAFDDRGNAGGASLTVNVIACP